MRKSGDVLHFFVALSQSLLSFSSSCNNSYNNSICKESVILLLRVTFKRVHNTENHHDLHQHIYTDINETLRTLLQGKQSNVICKPLCI